MTASTNLFSRLLARISDWQLEREIDAAHRELTNARGNLQRRAAWKRKQELLNRRAPTKASYGR